VAATPDPHPHEALLNAVAVVPPMMRIKKRMCMEIFLEEEKAKKQTKNGGNLEVPAVYPMKSGWVCVIL
jgi:hypothetical protein